PLPDWDGEHQSPEDLEDVRESVGVDPLDAELLQVRENKGNRALLVEAVLDLEVLEQVLEKGCWPGGLVRVDVVVLEELLALVADVGDAADNQAEGGILGHEIERFLLGRGRGCEQRAGGEGGEQDGEA